MFKDLALKATGGRPLNAPPDARQMIKINSMQPSGFEPLVSEELFCVTGVVADNLVNRSYGKWSVESLDQMSKRVVGVPSILDHNWGEVKVAWGRTFESFTFRHPMVDVPDELLDKAGNYDYNKKIVEKEGLYRCYATAFMRIDSEVLGMLRYVQANEISTGGFDYTDLICPLCDVPFGTSHCKHYPPSSYAGRDNDDPHEAPYYIRHNLIDIMEWSLVSLPNLPGAGVA